MGYCLTTPWNLAEFDKEGIVSIIGSSSLGVHKPKGDWFGDLKLARLGDSWDSSVDKVKNLGVSVMESSSTGSSKRARAPGNGTQVTSCLVDGCNSDLSKCRDYHRRHKVCELHSKTPKVTIAGQEQRFCQQCSRFHSLTEFDEGKRSCRKRLDGHNRRRRKPQPDSLSLTSGRFLSNHQGGFLAVSSPQMFPTSAVVSSAWSGAIKTENEAMLYSSHSQSQLNFKDSFPGSSSHSYKGGKQFPFLQGTDSTLPGVSVCQPFLDPNSSSGNGGSTHKMFSNGLNQVVDSDCALSLLSSPPSASREIGFSHMVQPNQIPSAQSLIPSLHYNGLRMEDETVGSVLVSDGSRNASLHSQGMFQIGPDDGSSASAPHQTLSFSWE